MKKRKLIHPHKVAWVMKDFINDIHGLTHMARNVSEEKIPSQVRMVKCEEGFAVCPGERGKAKFHFFYNIDELYSKSYQQFAQDFFSRCPRGRGFASVTIAILHEIGHMNTQQEFEGYNRERAIKELEKNFPNETINFEYFKLPDEKVATDWAIEWLNHPKNRCKAKEFEKKFFSCFK